MAENKRFPWKKLLWWLIPAVFAAVYALGLTLMCEAAGRVEMRTFWIFLPTEVGQMALKNTAVLTGVLILALYVLTMKLSVAVGLVSVPMLIFHIINAIKLTLRNEPFYPWDFTLAGEATNILSSVKLTFSDAMLWAMGYVALGLVLAIVLDLLLGRSKPGLKLRCAGFAALAGALMLMSGTWLSEGYIQANTIPLRTYNQHWSYKENGFVYTFAANIYHARIREPEHYSQSALRELTQGYEPREGSVEPNVIVVMSEAFADIWNAENLTFDRELAPNFNALAQRYLSGNCLTSEYGGNTANCEFEVLTGYSTYLAPTGTVMYMSYLNRKTDSYVSYLKSRDYYTVALHPYQRTFFSREKAFDLLSFDDYYSAEHFEGAERIREANLITDDAVADRIIAEYEKNEPSGRGFFCHTVTMLNHTSYVKADWSDEERVGMEASCDLTETEYHALASYATGITHADAMLGKLVDYFSRVEEPTVILFFGDHQPSLGTPGYELMQRIGYVRDNESDAGRSALQSTPYLIWNNFQTEPTAQRMDMSMFHLIPYMTRMLDMDRPAFHGYMDALFAEVRAVTRNVGLDGDGNPILMPQGQAMDKFQEYLTIVYDGLMGKQYANEALYGK